MAFNKEYDSILDNLDIIHYIDMGFVNLQASVEKNQVFPKKRVIYEPELWETSSEIPKQICIPTEKELKDEIINLISNDLLKEGKFISYTYIENYIQEKTRFPIQYEIDSYYLQ